MCKTAIEHPRVPFSNASLGSWSSPLRFGWPRDQRCNPKDRERNVKSLSSFYFYAFQRNSSFPLRAVLTCVPFWAVMVTQCGMAWAFYTQLTEMPTYLDHMLHFNLTDVSNSLCRPVLFQQEWFSTVSNFFQNAMLSSIPYLTSWISSLGFSWFADWLISRRYLTPVASFKIFNSLGKYPAVWKPKIFVLCCTRVRERRELPLDPFHQSMLLVSFHESAHIAGITCRNFVVLLASVVPSIGFIGVAFAGCDRQLAMILMSVLGTFVGAQYAGNQMNHIALSPRFAGTMYGMTNGVANICGILAPYIIGSINNDKVRTLNFS